MKKTKRRNSVSNVQKAMRAAVKKAVIERMHSGVSLSIWKNGKVVTIPARRIDLKSLGL